MMLALVAVISVIVVMVVIAVVFEEGLDGDDICGCGIGKV